MTSRERWTVYPLLFLSLGMSLRGRMAAADAAHEVLPSVNCRELTIVNHDNKPVARFGTTKDHSGLLEFYNSGGKPAVRFHTAKDQNGFLEFYNTDGKLALVEGVDKSGIGIFGISVEVGSPRLILPFNPVMRPSPKPEVQAPEEKQPDKEPESDEPTKPDAESP